ncbi:hypothetical protein EVAR_54171_1 [Eumeta japonica]|uniref:Uncharacterized protein n=1 Tax=Eumeta variegata TaxID=151549 RepID=A0A4C1XYW8_EUMVA|nr:hypothetical protein EVAR_54171_1 [Eumeta japonica]
METYRILPTDLELSQRNFVYTQSLALGHPDTFSGINRKRPVLSSPRAVKLKSVRQRERIKVTILHRHKSGPLSEGSANADAAHGASPRALEGSD